MQLTPGQAFYHRLSTAIEKQDIATLDTLYQPDAIQVSVNTGQILHGRAAVVAAIKEMLGLASPVKPVAIESFVELGDALCVEAVQETRFSQIQTYDIYEQLRAMYRPDATSISASLGAVVQGQDTIVSTLQQSMRTGRWPPQLISTFRFIETPNLICAEGISAQQLVVSADGEGPVLDLQFYQVFVLEDGAIRYQFTGLISPRPAELKQTRQKLSAAVQRARERSFDSLSYRRR
jgi:hypothetical protein